MQDKTYPANTVEHRLGLSGERVISLSEQSKAQASITVGLLYMERGKAPQALLLVYHRGQIDGDRERAYKRVHCDTPEHASRIPDESYPFVWAMRD